MAAAGRHHREGDRVLLMPSLAEFALWLRTGDHPRTASRHFSTLTEVPVSGLRLEGAPQRRGFGAPSTFEAGKVDWWSQSSPMRADIGQMDSTVP
jgi:hypothetical protein